MSLVLPFRCVICMMFYTDKIISANKTQACNHIYYDHDYTDKLRVGRLVDIINEDEKRSAWWLSSHLSELSFLRE
ncbi:hypothetical protein JYT57_00165 [Nitrosarchaeum koreense]|nr:hypothetical protein [Nitrosarchaeum koreense]